MMDKETVIKWLEESHTRTILMFAEEHNMDVSQVWWILDGDKK